jgi:hypothetical protein
VIATAIALKKTIHFRILIFSLNLRGYARRFQSTRQNPRAQSEVLDDVSPVSRCVRWTANSKRQMLQLRDNSAAT